MDSIKSFFNGDRGKGTKEILTDLGEGVIRGNWE